MSDPEVHLTEPAKLLLLASLLAKDGIISNNAKAFLKERILRRDPEVMQLLEVFDGGDSVDIGFINRVNKLVDDSASRMHRALFAKCPLEVSKALSKKEREDNDLLNEKSLIYGELANSFCLTSLLLLSAASHHRGSTFYDLGSGSGKALFVARLWLDFGRCIGLEILKGLHEAALEVVESYNRNYREVLASNQAQHVAVYCGSFLNHDWSDGTVVFANSTCFDDDLMAKMGKKAELLQPGSYLVTFTKGINSEKFQLLDKRRFKMSWGPATVFCHRRLGEDGQPVDNSTFRWVGHWST
ncbi:unnamed protein product [Chrysoparadoxa australica]